MSSLLLNLLHFSRLLGSLGLNIKAVRTLDIVHALQHIDIGRRTDFYHTLRSLLVHRPQDITLFDEAFRIFWRSRPDGWTTQDLRAMGEQRKTAAPQFESPAAPGSSEDDGSLRPVEVRQVAALSASARELFHRKDFAEFTEDEVTEARQMMADLRWDIGMKRTRRWQSGHGRIPDFHRVFRANVSYGYELVNLPTRQRRHRRRPLVLLCDVSGSMERYSRMLLHFLSCMSSRLDHVEVFLFATRLTRITRYLHDRPGRGPGSTAVQKLPSHVPDFAGGTRIGEALREFNLTWSRRVLGRGAVVLMISDGWDRGDPDRLGVEMGRLHRASHRLIWLNPLLGSANYAPLTRGMQAALPHIDNFLPVHNLESLTQLGEYLNAMPTMHKTGILRPDAALRGLHVRRATRNGLATSPRPEHAGRMPTRLRVTEPGR